MSEDEKRSEEEVEAHHHPKLIGATDEPQDEVEAHHHPKLIGANDEPQDDVEAHMRRGV